MSHIPGNDESSRGSSGESAGAALNAIVDAYIDGRMTVTERAAFEARLTREPALRAEVDAHRRLEAMLREEYAERPTSGLAGASTERADASDTGRIVGRPVVTRTGRWWIGLAAAVMLLVAGWQWGLPLVTRQSGPEARLVAEYAAQVSAGFVPREVCTTSEAFVAWTVKAYGIGISPAALPANVQLLGWTRRDTLSSYTGVLLARVDGREVVVFMDPSDAVVRDGAWSGKGLRVFSQRVGALTLYEVTPDERPAVLPGLKQVETSR